MNFKHDRSFNLKLNDDKWYVALVTAEESVELDEELNDSSDGFRALTLTGEDGHAFFFVEGSVTPGIVAHELYHAYVSYFHLESANVDTEAFEEITAEFLEANLDKFIRVRNKIYNKLKKLEGAG